VTTSSVLHFNRSARAARAVAVPVICGVRRWMRDDVGISAVEYALLGSLIALAIVGAVSGLATTMSKVFDDLATSI
jgi:pilus assembly protein Flp/PilA